MIEWKTVEFARRYAASVMEKEDEHPVRRLTLAEKKQLAEDKEMDRRVQRRMYQKRLRDIKKCIVYHYDPAEDLKEQSRKIPCTYPKCSRWVRKNGLKQHLARYHGVRKGSP